MASTEIDLVHPEPRLTSYSQATDTKLPWHKSAIGKLPNEVLSEIISFATHSASLTRWKQYTLPSTLRLVSRLWADVVDQTHGVWNVILIQGKMMLEPIKTRLSRSGRAPLYITISKGTHGLDPPAKEAMACLIPEWERWASVELSLYDASPYIRLFPRTLPRLYHFYLYSAYGLNSEFYLTAPQLTHVKIEQTTMFWDPSTLTLANLTSFHFSMTTLVATKPMETIIDQIQNCPYLEELVLSRCWLEPHSFDHAILSKRRISLPGLKKLTLGMCHLHELYCLLSVLQVPNLKTLGIGASSNRETLPADDWHKLKLDMPILETLILKSWGAPEQYAVHLLQQLPPIRTLWLSHTFDAWYEDEGSTDMVFEALFTAPGLDSLTSNMDTLYVRGFPVDLVCEVIRKLGERSGKQPTLIMYSGDSPREKLTTEELLQLKEAVIEEECLIFASEADGYEW